MRDIRTIRFKDFITLQRGFDLPKNDMVEGPYPVVGSTSIIGYHCEYKIYPPGVVTGRSGSLGSVQYITTKYWPHNTALWVKDFKGNNPRYVYYYLKTIDLKRFNSGAGVPTLNRNDLDTLEIKIHGEYIQRKIASILSAYDDLIENNTRRIKILEKMAQAIYREWFVEFRFPGVETHGRASLLRPATPDEQKLTGKNVFPKEWEVKKLGELVDFQKGRKPKNTYQESNNGNIPYLLLEGIEGGKYIYTDDTRLTIAEKDDVVMVMDGARSGLVFIGVSGAVGSTLATFRPKEKKIVSPYLLYQFLKDQFENIIKKNVGSAIPHASKDFIFGMPFFLPTESINKKYNEICEPLYIQVQNLKLKNINLRRTRDLLLPKLISGEIDVEELDIAS